MKNILYENFSRGLWTLAPISLTIIIMLWIISFLERSFKVPITYLIGDYYFPGMGILAASIFITFIGIIINNWLIKKLYTFGDNLIRKTPFIKTIYDIVANAVSFFDTDGKQTLNRVVLIDIAGFKIFGFITRETFDDLPNIAEKEEVAVYVPFSYQLGGYTFIVSKSKIKIIDMAAEDAMRFSVTAGLLKKNVSTPKK